MSLLLARRIVSSQTISTDSIFLQLSSYSKSAVSSNDDFLQKSHVPTMHFQKSLPRLPIPKLEDSCRRYLNAQKPLLSDDEFEKTQLWTNKFLKEDGLELQKELVLQDSRNRHTSFISEPWFDMYLRDRKPLPINYNPFLVFSPETDDKYNQQLVKATNLIISSLRFLKSLRANLLEPEVFHLNPKKSDTKFFRSFTGLLPSSLSWYGAYLMNAYPLDMSQYKNLFNSTRIPLLEKDKIKMDTSAKHIVVLRKGKFYTFDVFNENNNIIDAHQIAKNLQYILEDQSTQMEHSVATLTSAERNTWARARFDLEEIGNSSVLEKIDSAAFVLIFEEDSINNDEQKLLKTFLHGKSENRWFDKSFSIIITKDGYAGINFEHSWGDGVAVLRYFQDVKKDISEKPRFHPDDVNYLSTKSASVSELNFNLNKKLKDIISIEKLNYNKWCDELDIGFMIYEGFGKKECKSFGVSPDAIMQLVFQLTLYKQEMKSVATYESCSTSAFKHGRTETIRSCTMQTKKLCSIIAKNLANNSEDLKKMIVECSNAHNTLTKEAAMGQGFDRHLFALRKIAEQNNKKLDIYQDPAYKMINHNILSTSTLSSPVVIAGGFGPVVDDGFGIGYMIQDERLGAVVTSYRKHRKATDYVQLMKSSFQDIHVLLSK